MAWGGGLLTDPFDVASAGANGAAPFQPGSLTPSQDNSLIAMVVGLNMDELQVPVVDSGYTVLDFVGAAGGSNYASSSVYFVQSTAGAINPTVTSNGDCAIQAAFKPFVSGGATPTTRLPLLGVG